MDHNTIQEQLFALYDGELTGTARLDIERHLLDCATCCDLLAQWKRVAGACLQAPAVATSEVLVQRVMQRIATPRRHPLRVHLPRWLIDAGWLAPAVGVAALFLVIVNGPAQQMISIETLLLSDGHESAALQQVLTGETPSSDELLGLLMEEAS